MEIPITLWMNEHYLNNSYVHTYNLGLWFSTKKMFTFENLAYYVLRFPISITYLIHI